MFRVLTALDAWDRRLFQRLTRRERRIVDTNLKRMSNSAKRSVLWLAIAALVALLGGRRGRRAALRGVISIALTSTLVNLPLKYLARRDRPPMRRGDRPLPVSLPGSFSFPSGHSASAFAFAAGVALEDPRLLGPILPLAGGVAYSRVHLRVHYPLDVLAGVVIGTMMGLASEPIVRVVREWWDAIAPVPEAERAQTNEVILVSSPHAGKGANLARAKTAMSGTGLKIVAELSVDNIARLPGLLSRNGSNPPIVVAAGGDGDPAARHLQRLRALHSRSIARRERGAPHLQWTSIARRCRTPQERRSPASTFRARGGRRSQRAVREVRDPCRPAPAARE